MSWPALDMLMKGIDISLFNNVANLDPDREQGLIDFAELASAHPEILVAVSRIAGAWSGVDVDWQHNYSDSLAAGFFSAGYLNNNASRGAKSVDRMMSEWWKPAIDSVSQVPSLIVVDAETNGWFNRDTGQWIDRVPAADCTKNVRDILAVLREEYPAAVLWIYTAAWWWNTNIVHGWEGAELFWIAHYPFFNQNSQGEWVKVRTFEESDAKLPITNNFTPKLPIGIALENVAGWQITDIGELETVEDKTNDLNYFRRRFIDAAFGDLSPPGNGNGGGGQVIDVTDELRAIHDNADRIEAKLSNE